MCKLPVSGFHVVSTIPTGSPAGSFIEYSMITRLTKVRFV